MKLNYVDSIRGVAILMVIFVHTSLVLNDLEYYTQIIASYGQMGVQLFFVASAYTLCLSHDRRQNEPYPLIKFGIRRYFRIAPGYYFGIMVFFMISLLQSILQTGHIILPDYYSFLNVASNVFFLHGFYPPANNNIVPGGWSIGTEMAFYALFPVLFSIARGKCTSVANIIVFLFVGLAVSQLSLQLLGLADINISNNSFIYYNLVNQLPVFMLGIAYYFLKRDFNFRIHWLISLVLFVMLTIISVYFWYSSTKYYFSVIPLISGLSFICVFELFQKFEFLNIRLLIRIGQVSFSMYLLHIIFAHLMTGYLISRFRFDNATITLIMYYVLTVFLTFGAALLSEKFIEQPGIDIGKKLIKRLK